MTEWKTIDGYDNYLISDFGDVFSKNINKKLCQKKHYKGYFYVTLSQNGKTKAFKTHRLVGQAFVENPNGLPQINHINGIKTDNRASNLEWCNNSYNQKEAYRLGLRRITRGKDCALFNRRVLHGTSLIPVKVIINGTEHKYISIAECSEDLKMSPKYIGQVISGKRKLYRGLLFERADYEN